MTSSLESIHTPGRPRRLSRPELQVLAAELREFVLQSVSKTGGHLSSNLGTVELTIALHYVFNTPHDRIVWDVGHQTYPHKILTGRRERMGTLRQLGGISGFPRRAESEYDTFGTAHSSTSISAALGMAVAARLKGENRKAVAVIGDGAMSAGMAFEALNNAGVSQTDLLVILNDNDMSISPPVGALNRYLARLMSGKFYAAARETGKNVLKNAPPLFELARRFEEHAKGMVVPGTMFEEFGFNYIGPIDGHDLDSLVPTLENLRDLKGPQFLHVVTKKGQGYKLAEADPVAYHGPGKFDPGGRHRQAGDAAGKPTFTQVFGQWLCDMAEKDERLVGITPAMREGSGMVEFEKRFPDRYFDVGIAEQHAVTFAAGLACEGLKPVLAIYSTFLQRGYDQLIHDVAIQNLPVRVRARSRRPGRRRRRDPCRRLRHRLPALRAEHERADAGRRGRMPAVALHRLPPGPSGRGALSARRRRGPAAAGGDDGHAVRQGRDPAREHAQRRQPGGDPGLRHACCIRRWRRPSRLDATVANMRFAKPLDVALVTDLARRHDAIVTVEEGAIMGGAGSAVLEALRRGADRDSGADPRPARRLHRARRSGQAALALRPRRGRHRAVGAAPLRHHAGAGAQRGRRMKPPRSLRSLPPEGAWRTLGAARRVRP